jgi:hypothetical protein
MNSNLCGGAKVKMSFPRVKILYLLAGRHSGRALEIKRNDSVDDLE